MMLDAAVRERLEKALAFERPDRIPICEFLSHSKLFRFYSDDSWSGAARAYQELGIDMCWLPERRSGERASWYNRILGRWLRVREVRVLNQSVLQAELEEYRAQRELFLPRTYLAYFIPGILHSVFSALGQEEFSRRMYADPLGIDRLIEVAAENLRLRCQQFASHAFGPAVCIQEQFTQGAALFSRHFLEHAWVRRFEQAVSPVRENGIRVIVHTSGNISPLLDLFPSAGVDGIHPVACAAGMDPVKIRKEFGRALVLCCGVDLSRSGIADFPGELTKILSEYRRIFAEGGCFIGSCSGIRDAMSLPQIFSYFGILNQ